MPGAHLRAGGEDGDSPSTAACLKFPDPSPIPENIKKFRKSCFAEAGSRVVHPGLVCELSEF